MLCPWARYFTLKGTYSHFYSPLDVYCYNENHKVKDSRLMLVTTCYIFKAIDLTLHVMKRTRPMLTKGTVCYVMMFRINYHKRPSMQLN